jgi:hypothetical protein
MANDGMSSSMTGTTSTAMSPGTGASGRPRGLPVRDTASGTVVTAEIPAVPVGPSYGVLLPDGSVWYPGSRKRLPAPLIMRVVVWILVFAVFIVGAGDFVIRYHPSWLAALRHTVSAQSAPALAASKLTPPSTTRAQTAHTSASSMLTPISPPPAGLPSNTTAYKVHSPVYTVAVTAGTQAAWVGAQLDSAGRPVNPPFQEQTLNPGQTLKVNPATSDEFINIGRGGTTIKVYNASTLLATVPPPAHCPCYILLVPVGH